jgi:hypothetical protein
MGFFDFVGVHEQLPGFEGYMIDASARATFSSGFERYVLQHDNTH